MLSQKKASSIKTSKKVSGIKVSKKVSAIKVSKKEGCIYTEEVMKEKHFNSDYLKNRVCKFIPLFNFDPKVKKNIVSVCFFKMNTGSYKDFSKYYNGVTLLYKTIQKELPDFYLRVFIDMSIYNDKVIMNELKKNEKIELVLYCCESFSRDEQYHLGTFGTMMRLFPLFNFKNNDTNRVIITDIDIDGEYVDMIFSHYHLLVENYSVSEVNKLYLFNKSVIINNLELKNYLPEYKFFVKKNYINPYVYLNYMVGIRKIPPHIIENFLLDNVKTKNRYSTYPINYNNDANIFYNRCDEFVCYGIDEYFSHIVLYPYLINNNMPISYLVEYNIYRFMKILITELKARKDNNDDSERLDKLKSYIYILTNNVCDDQNIKKCINMIISSFNILIEDQYLQKKLYNKNSYNSIIANNYYKLLFNLKKNKDYSIFNKDILNIFLSKDIFRTVRKSFFINHNSSLKNKSVGMIVKL